MQLKLWINLPKGELDDPQNMARDVSEVGHWGNGDYQVLVESSGKFDYLMTLIKQSYSKHS
jgi:predicted transport protein